MIVEGVIILVFPNVRAVNWVFSVDTACLVLELCVESPWLATKNIVATVHKEGVISNENWSIRVSKVDVDTIPYSSSITQSDDKQVTLRWSSSIDGSCSIIIPVWSESKTLDFEKDNDFFPIVIPSNSSCDITWHFSCVNNGASAIIQRLAVHFHGSPIVCLSNITVKVCCGQYGLSILVLHTKLLQELDLSVRVDFHDNSYFEALWFVSAHVSCCPEIATVWWLNNGQDLMHLWVLIGITVGPYVLIKSQSWECNVLEIVALSVILNSNLPLLTEIILGKFEDVSEASESSY